MMMAAEAKFKSDFKTVNGFQTGLSLVPQVIPICQLQKHFILVFSILLQEKIVTEQWTVDNDMSNDSLKVTQTYTHMHTLTHTHTRTRTHTNTHTHTFNGPFSGTTRVRQYQKGKTNLDFTEARYSKWQWHHLGHMQVCISLQTDNHASTPPLKFFTGRMPFLPPNQQP